MMVAALAAGAILAQKHLAASAPPPARSTEVDSRPRIEVVHPRRVTVAQRLQTNATLAAFEEADLFAKVTGYLSDVRVDIGDHVKAGQILAVIDIPELEQQLAEDQAQLASKQSALETARRQVALGDDAPRAQGDYHHQDLYARSVREIHYVPPLKYVLTVRLFRRLTMVFSASLATIRHLRELRLRLKIWAVRVVRIERRGNPSMP